MKRFNSLGLLSLLALIAVLGLLTDNKGWFGFLGFLYYLRYFQVIPDEFFLENVRKTATLAFFTGMLSLVVYVSSAACSLARHKRHRWPSPSALPPRSSFSASPSPSANGAR